AAGKPRVEEDGLEELAASAEAVLAGLGPLAAGLAGLAAGVGGAGTLEAMEMLAWEKGLDLLRGVIQLGLDSQAAAEVRVPQVTGADGVPRRQVRRGQERTGVTRRGGGLPPRAVSADGKGVAMRPEARRPRATAPGKRARTFRKRTGTGEKKGCKRMAETGCVFDVIAPDGPPRTPEEIMTREPGE